MGGMEQFAKHERGGPSGPRLVTPWLDHDLRRYLLLLALRQLGEKRPDVVVAKPDTLSRDDDPFRIEDYRDAGQDPADVTSGPLDCPGHLGIAGGERSDVLRLDEAPRYGQDIADDGRL
jgi:hypothetical protein